MTSTPTAWWFERQRFGVQPGLDRVRALLADLGDPQDAFRTVLVGGTNGKGTTAAALAACLGRVGGGPVGLFTSPHLERVTERFVIDGAPVDASLLDRVLREVQPHAERHAATFFEIATAVAVRIFATRGVERAVFEVGLGGRWDATNVLEPVQSVVTGVALDHTDVLGDDVAGIARDKAGILRPGVPAATGATGVAGEVVEARARELGAPLWRVGREIVVDGAPLGWEGQTLAVRTPAGSVRTSTRILGAHQRRNLALAVAAAQRAGVGGADIAAAIPAVTWPGRLERFRREGRTVVLDGAHNAQAAAALGAALRDLDATPYVLILGVGADKDVRGVAEALVSGAVRVVATRATKSPRASDAGSLADLVRALGAPAVACADPAAALAEGIRTAEPGETVLVAGSLYLVGEVRSLLSGREPEAFDRWQ